MTRHSLTCMTAAALLALSATIALAAPMKVTADLKGSAETPPNSSSGSGTMTGTYDPATKMLTWDVTYEKLTGAATMAHFHAPAPVGKPAPVEIPITGSLASPFKGEATLSADQAKNLTDGMTYLNIHTQKNPKGEIRGQVMLSQ